MSLITPDFGLLFWMTLIFAIVFFILAKFGFPVITKMVRGRQERIETSIRQAKEIEARVEEMAREHAGMLEETRREQARILREATEGRKQILEQAREDARGEAQKIVDEARARIAEERESALRDIRREVALLSVEVAEQIVRKELSSDAAQADYLNPLVDEAVGKAN